MRRVCILLLCCSSVSFGGRFPDALIKSFTQEVVGRMSSEKSRAVLQGMMHFNNRHERAALGIIHKKEFPEMIDLSLCKDDTMRSKLEKDLSSIPKQDHDIVAALLEHYYRVGDK